jgi:ABC-type bacteriocin/lantibiotic exporter with double-glycine peptidase domain
VIACLSTQVLNVQVPFIFKEAIDMLGAPGAVELASSSPLTPLFVSAGTVMLAYGGARTGASLFEQLRSVVFAKVAQRSIRALARTTFSNLLNMDLNYHLSRQTGHLSRAIDRGTRGINFLLSSMLFNVVPTALEVSLVAAILSHKCGPVFAAVTIGSVGTYALFTFKVSGYRVKQRQVMNEVSYLH